MRGSTPSRATASATSARPSGGSTSTAKRIRGYAGRDPELRALVAELEAEAQHFTAPMPAMALKEAHFNASNTARSRDLTGKALRRS